LQEKLLAGTRCPVLTMTLNMPGSVKRTALSAFFFDREKARLTASLEALGGKFAAEESSGGDTGDQWLLAVCGLSAMALKTLTLALEEGSPWGRLLDLDVMDRDGRPLERPSLGLSARQCLICGQPAYLCAASGAHPANLLQEQVESLLAAYAEETLADMTASLALEASSYELMVAPKPGLVTPFCSGSHHDMDRFTFIKSQAVLAPYYRHAFRIGWMPGKDQALRLRLEGIRAEAAMAEETGGINTHRGWIYLSGILLAVAGTYCAALFSPRGKENKAGRDQVAGDLMALAAELALDLEESLEKSSCFDGLSARLGTENQVRGIRGEAARGFPSLFNLGLPVLSGALAGGEDENTAGIRTLLALLAHADDSTLRKRGGAARAEKVRETIRKALGLDGGDANPAGLVSAALALPAVRLASLAEETAGLFKDKGLSCGGAADLLAGSRLADRFLRACTGAAQ